MKILFIYPSISRNLKFSSRILKPLAIQPLAFAVLSGLMPKEWGKKFYDERIEAINFKENCDLVAISVETYNAKRAYEVSKIFRDAGRKVVLGGFHPTLCPDEAMLHADSIVVGEAEQVWNKLLSDFKNNTLQKIYKAEDRFNMEKIHTDRTIFHGKKYYPISLVESGRGCCFNCDFCSIYSFYKGKYIRRPIEETISEIKNQPNKFIMFTDDNICADINSSKKLFTALIPLKIKWAAQSSINIHQDEELLWLIKKSGCLGLLIGFESLDNNNLSLMKKNLRIDYDNAIETFYKFGIRIYGSFVIGYDFDNKDSIHKMINYAMKKKFFIANFYQLTPFPGTQIYERLKNEGRLLYDKWWLDKDYAYGKIVYKPKLMNPKELALACWRARKEFYSFFSIIKRLRFNCEKNSDMLLYFAINMSSKKLAYKRQWLNLG
ncbi:MAG: hypothetical protein US74_C0017G0007 [Parcubacteria group bacterium GW2011_GWA2_38_13]|nr:MAG: hypothetical protein US74_C0017G0007 [Parcubacteria group bacterium GW2011_GWA2_38_13]